MPSRRVTAVTATTSGGATIAPSTNAAGHGIRGMIAWATAATTTIVRTTRSTPSRVIDPMFCRKSRNDVVIAAA